MQQFRIILLLLLSFSVAFFAIINHDPIDINFFYINEFSISKALVVLVCISIGSIGTMFAFIPAMLRRKKLARGNEKEKKVLNKELSALKDEHAIAIEKLTSLETDSQNSQEKITLLEEQASQLNLENETLKKNQIQEKNE